MNTMQSVVVLVTGANRGLGLALVEELLAGGVQKVYAATRQPRSFDDPRVITIALDLSDDASIKKLSELAPDVNLVINNAGVFMSTGMAGVDVYTLRAEFAVNFFGHVQVAQAMAPVLKNNGGGAMAFINTAMAWIPSGSYGASKAALLAATNTLRLELAPQHTQVLSVHTGPIDTDMVKMLDLPKHPPKEVADAILKALADGQSELLLDDLTRHAKSLASGPVEDLRTAV